MSISKDKKRIMITLEIELINKIKKIAKNNNKTVSEEIAFLINRYSSENKSK